MTHAFDIDLLSAGSWAIFDHLAQLERYPLEGQTLRITSDLDPLLNPRYGDCSANVAAVAARLGLRTGLAMVVGDDFITSGYADHLMALGVDLGGVEVREGESSGHNYLFFDADAKGFCLSHLGIARQQEGWRVPLAQVDRARAVVVSEMFSPYTLGLLDAARQRGRLTAINGMVASAGVAAVEFLRSADILFIAASELRDLLMHLGLERPEALLGLGLERMFVTHGSRGSVTWGADGLHAVPAVAVERVIDTTGAGDAFVAGTLAGLLKGMPADEAASVGAASASFVIEAWGAQTRLPSWDEMMARRESHIAPESERGGS